MQRPAILGGPRSVPDAKPVWPKIDAATLQEIERVLTTEPLCPVGNTGIQGEFENRFAAFHGRNFALATNGGTAALMLSVHGSGVQPGDEVIVSPFTWGASISCALQCGGIPIFADIQRSTFALDPDAVRAVISERTRAIVVVHLFGGPANLNALRGIADEHGIALIEDCAQAAGGWYDGQRLGTIGDFGAFSLQASKNLTGGEGGILICDDREMFERAMSMGTHPQRLFAELTLPEFQQRIDSLAFNYRMHTTSAAIAKGQLDHLDQWTDMRNDNAAKLYDAVKNFDFLEIPEIPNQTSTSKHAFYHMPFIYRPGVLPIDRDLFCRALSAEGMTAEPYVRIPFHLRPRIQNHDYFGRGYPWSLADSPPRYQRGDCPVAEEICEVEFQIKDPLHEECSDVVAGMVEAFRKIENAAEAIAAAASEVVEFDLAERTKGWD